MSVVKTWAEKRAERQKAKEFEKLRNKYRKRIQESGQAEGMPKSPADNTDTSGSESNFWQYLKISKQEYEELKRFRANYEARNNVIVFFIGVLFTPISLAGALLGFGRAYYRFSYIRNLRVYLYPMRPITRVAMIMGAILIWLITIAIIIVLLSIIWVGGYKTPIILGYLIGNTFFSLMVFGSFKLWQSRVNNALIEGNKFGSARFARRMSYTRKKIKQDFISAAAICSTTRAIS